ncbi:MAG: hypothetical protein Tp138OMZ00d2C19078241_16 [Prokaryotic dsDNA virus sp.]|jgi:hypothetical protein|nr:MAG: hypothetical protein Tp138OMZ00d2C19078241_16 [Prokaryotic dsDNA virus sp.]|tara:strand:- start:30090 stop:30284 length:195 start_codon:yes stop_codon:yes gene_type:complete
MIEPGQRKIYALKTSLSAIAALGLMYCACLGMGWNPDPTVFAALGTSVGVITGSFNWSNAQERR